MYCQNYDVKYRTGSIKVPGAGSVPRRKNESVILSRPMIYFLMFLIIKINYTVIYIFEICF